MSAEEEADLDDIRSAVARVADRRRSERNEWTGVEQAVLDRLAKAGGDWEAHMAVHVTVDEKRKRRLRRRGGKEAKDGA